MVEDNRRSPVFWAEVHLGAFIDRFLAPFFMGVCWAGGPRSVAAIGDKLTRNVLCRDFFINF